MCTKQVILKTFLKKSNFIIIKLYLCAADNYRILCFFLNSGFLTFTIYVSLSRFNFSQKFLFFKANMNSSSSLFFPFYGSSDGGIMQITSKK